MWLVPDTGEEVELVREASRGRGGAERGRVECASACLRAHMPLETWRGTRSSMGHRRSVHTTRTGHQTHGADDSFAPLGSHVDTLRVGAASSLAWAGAGAPPTCIHTDERERVGVCGREGVGRNERGERGVRGSGEGGLAREGGLTREGS